MKTAGPSGFWPRQTQDECPGWGAGCAGDRPTLTSIESFDRHDTGFSSVSTEQLKRAS
jgi:hypothetical protein